MMGDSSSASVASANDSNSGEYEATLFEATPDEDGIWRDSKGVALPVSASDLERHAYCPLSWKLARSGVKGSGDAIELGKQRHKEIERAMKKYQNHDLKARREMVIWTWWFAIVVTLTIDTAAFFFVEEGMIADSDFARFARYLALLALVWLILAILLLVIPWRRYLGTPFGLAQPPIPSEFNIIDLELYLFEKGDSNSGGWWAGGKVEFTILLGSMTIALHGFALFEAQQRSIATFVLLVATLGWTLIASWQLHKGLLASIVVEEKGKKLGMDSGSVLAYNDDSTSSDLLKDDTTGIRGRPDQIIIFENEVVPVEQKTGKIPSQPHFSHKLQVYAYLHLVSKITNNQLNYGILRYGDDAIHKISWGDGESKVLMKQLKEIQRLMVEGGAKRDHDRPGKCRNCSRRHRCPEALD
jgi:CRISPR-associated exonuclease Cas4